MSARRPTTSFGFDEAADAALAMYQRRAAAEVHFVATAMSDPARAVPVAEEAGVRLHHLEQPDLKTIYGAALVSPDRSQVAVAKLAKRFLCINGHWDRTQIAGNAGAMLWSDEALAAFAESWFFSAPVIMRAAGMLLALV